MKNRLSSFMKRFEHTSEEESKPEVSYASFEEEFIVVSQKTDDVEWKAPNMLHEEDNFDFVFPPQAKEQEPAIQTPKPYIESQGVQCLRLGELSYI